jgi:hypothetical protein
MAFYSIGGQARNGILRPRRSVGPDPYDPGSPAFSSRNRQTETVLPNGLTRVDIGEPVKRLPSEGLRSTSHTLKVAPAPPPEPLAATPIDPPRPQAAHPQSHREPWGLNRGEV